MTSSPYIEALLKAYRTGGREAVISLAHARGGDWWVAVTFVERWTQEHPETVTAESPTGDDR